MLRFIGQIATSFLYIWSKSGIAVLSQSLSLIEAGYGQEASVSAGKIATFTFGPGGKTVQTSAGFKVLSNKGGACANTAFLSGGVCLSLPWAYPDSGDRHGQDPRKSADGRGLRPVRGWQGADKVGQAADLNGRLQLRTPLENAKELYAFRIHLLYLQHSGFRTGSVQPDSDNHLLGLNTWASGVEEEPEFRPCPAPLTGGTTLPMRLGLVDSSFRQATGRRVK